MRSRMEGQGIPPLEQSSLPGVAVRTRRQRTLPPAASSTRSSSRMEGQGIFQVLSARPAGEGQDFLQPLRSRLRSPLLDRLLIPTELHGAFLPPMGVLMPTTFFWAEDSIRSQKLVD